MSTIKDHPKPEGSFYQGTAPGLEDRSRTLVLSFLVTSNNLLDLLPKIVSQSHSPTFKISTSVKSLFSDEMIIALKRDGIPTVERTKPLRPLKASPSLVQSIEDY